MMPQSTVRPGDMAQRRRAGTGRSSVALCLHAAGGFPTLATGYYDSLLRWLVEVRDLIGGQGWFDLHQYRMGPPGGFVMYGHVWSMRRSRRSSLPYRPFPEAGDGRSRGPDGMADAADGGGVDLHAEDRARRRRRLGASAGAHHLHRGAAFRRRIRAGRHRPPQLSAHAYPGRHDGADHRTQLRRRDRRGRRLRGDAGGWHGNAALCRRRRVDGICHISAGRAARAGAKAAGFGIGLAGGGLFAFMATVPAESWLAPQCDAYSLPQFAVAVMSGLGLAAAAVAPALGRSFGGRFGALLALGVAVAVLMVAAFPQCLAKPYAGLDRGWQQFWLNHVTEAQPFWRVLSHNWAKAAGYYVTPVLALIVLGLRLRRCATPASWMLMVFLGSQPSSSASGKCAEQPSPCPLQPSHSRPGVGDWRQRTALASDPSSRLRMALVWLGSLEHRLERRRPCGIGRPGEKRLRPRPRSSAATALPMTPCSPRSRRPRCLPFPTSARLSCCAPCHRLAWPDHRNVAGNLLTLEAFMGTAEQARIAIDRNRIGLVADARGNGETALLTEPAPMDFLAASTRGETPSWLEKLPQAAGEPLEIYRVRPQRWRMPAARAPRAPDRCWNSLRAAVFRSFTYRQ